MRTAQTAATSDWSNGNTMAGDLAKNVARQVPKRMGKADMDYGSDPLPNLPARGTMLPPDPGTASDDAPGRPTILPPEPTRVDDAGDRPALNPDEPAPPTVEPLRRPRESTPYAVTPIPSSDSTGKMRSSGLRLTSEYSIWRSVMGWVACARRIVSTPTSDRPTART